MEETCVNILKTGIEFDKCCGCQACVQACPKNALKMVANDDGFLFPTLDSNACIDCKLCAKVCPINEQSLSKLAFNKADSAVASIHKDDQIAQESSSGGAFSAIAQAFCIDGECVFFGAELQEDFSVVHKKAETLAELSAFRKSKYVPSSIENTYAQARNLLKENKRVLFSGTPCQIAGLKLFVGEKLCENLFTVDFSCHGVGSPSIWKTYLANIEKRTGKKIKRFDFRAKSRSFSTYSSQCSRTIFDDGTEIVRFKDPWFKAFVSALFKRSSCKDCPFSQPCRVSDITIADFWGIERISKNWDSGKGVSLMLLNTPKGRALYDNIAKVANVEKFSFEECLKYNVPLREKVVPHPKAKQFKKLLETEDFESALIKILGKPTFLQRATEYFLRLFPIRTQHKITKTTKGFTGSVKIILLKMLPNSVASVVMSKWANLNGRKYINSQKRKNND